VRTRNLSLSITLTTALFAATVRAAESDGIVEYTATYEGLYKGRHVADARFSVAADDDGYVFASETKARGLLRIASPKPAIERSRFRVDDGEILPSSYDFEDGSRKGDDNYSITFDSAAGEIRVTGPEVAKTLPFEPDLLDLGSIQVALMRDLASCNMPAAYRVVDDDGIKVYGYERLDDEEIETGIGAVTAVRLVQQREDSSRRVIIWLAPAYAFVPVRIEQIRDGETRSVMALESLSGIERSDSACSGFR
jgi:hypothetical protein